MFGILRTILAIYVVLLHIFSVPVLGNYAVSFFFLLSGFLMTYIMHETYGYTLGGYKVFWLNRILRLYPMYLLVIGFTVLAIVLLPNSIRNPQMFFPKTFWEWITNITMLYPNVVPHRFVPRLAPTSWALTNELVFYFLISMGISKTWKRTFLWFLLSVLYYVGTYVYYDIATYRYSAIPAASLPFALGACLYWVVKNRKPFRVSLFPIFSVFIMFNVNAILGLYLPPYLREMTIYSNMILAFILIYLLFNYKPKVPLKSIDDLIGTYSYPLYLSHYLIALIYSGVVGFGVINNSFKMQLKALVPFFVVLFIFNFCLLLFNKRVDIFKSDLKSKYLKKIKSHK
ncbi:acyltransferase [Aestuariivivens sp. NBU2969]|uniref:acyltransferase family protein n=1 Tax=Aestuariivivens sp. NBU2969 TaxID=2873267 RepID=UPI001CBE44E9|nr:acyltransferase [Aestuariivivens sp. NBU2969]